MCEANKTAVLASSPGQRQKTKRMDEYVVESTCGAGSETCGSTESEDFKRKLLFPCLDRMICELERCFCGVNEEVLNGIQACSPTSGHFLSESLLTALALHDHTEHKSEEVIVAKNFLKHKSAFFLSFALDVKLVS